METNTNIITFYEEDEIKYMFTNDLMIGIKIIDDSPSHDSQHLYINQNFVIDPLSPLAKFIDYGLIIKVGPVDTFVKQHKSDAPTVELYYMKDGVNNKIEGTFLKYRFFRKLIDKRFTKTGQFIAKEGKEYYNENDCLHFSEFLTMTHALEPNQFICPFPYTYETSVLKAKVPHIIILDKHIFGISDEENIKISKLKTLQKDNNAIPEPGESYAIVRKELKDANMYHIAFCLYSHNGVNITLEANADNGRLYLPTFNLYDRNPDNQITFHKTYSSVYDNSTTIVLKQRNIEHILNEIVQEEEDKYISRTATTSLGGKRKRKTQKRNKYRQRKTLVAK